MVQSASALHLLPHLGMVTNTHWPVAGWQKSAVQASPSSHLVAWPWQTPALHASLAVHASPSLHAAPLPTGWERQVPLWGSQLSWVQALPSLQLTVGPGWQLLDLQTSPTVHPLPSLQVIPLVAPLMQ